jgi:hypothetical protein
MNTNNNTNYKDGIYFASADGYNTIDTLTHKSGIQGVPLDSRNNCRDVLLESLRRPKTSNKTHLLCSVAAPGTGKTVLQRFNMKWFVDKTNGIAIETTFDDDQSSLIEGKNGDMADDKDLELAIAVRIIHRIIQKYGSEKDLFDDFQRDSKLVHSLYALKHPIHTTLRLLKHLNGAPLETPVLITIDALGKADVISGYSIKQALTHLGNLLDHDPTLFLSVTDFSALDLTSFCAETSRKLLLQTLNPLEPWIML